MTIGDRWIRSAEITSTGIDRQRRNPPPFHASNSRLKKGQLPLPLYCRSRISAASTFTSTSHVEHSRKSLTGPLANTKYSLAPPHWRAHTMRDLNRRIEDCWALRVLPHPISETRDNYRGQPARISPPTAHHEQLNFCAKLAADQIMAPPLSTSHRDYRLFNSSELNSSYSGQGKGLPEGPTKSSAFSHIPAHKAPSITLRCPGLLRRSAPVPHGAYTSVYRNSFTTLAASRTLSHHLQSQHVST